MTRDEIYDHLAQVYLGKRNQKEERKHKASQARRTVGKFLAAVFIVFGVLGLTAFLYARHNQSGNNVIFALSNSPVRITYNLFEPYPQIKRFSIALPEINAAKYENLQFSIRGTEDGYPGIVKVVVTNTRNETSVYFVRDVGLKWQRVNVSLDEFETITDWTNITDVSFVLEAWNIERKRGVVLIEDLSFSG